MNIQEMKEKKKEKGYTNEQIAELSGVPLGTVQKIFGGTTTSPRYDTLKALEKIFLPMERYYASDSMQPDTLRSHLPSSCHILIPRYR